MTNEQKKQVKEALVRYVSKFPTQTQAADTLQGISASTISQVKNNNWEMLSDRLWHHVARQVGFYCGEWQPADTSAYLLLRILFSDAQHYAMAYGIAIGDGLGKTFTASHYTRESDNTYYIAGSEDYNRKSFIIALLASAGIVPKGTVPDMMKQVSDHLAQKENPLLILDDAHRLKDRVLHLAILLANCVAGKVGIIIMGGTELRSRILDGVRLKKVGYDEIYKTIGRRFITLGSLGPRDVELVCRANGLFDDDVIAHITGQCCQPAGQAGLHTAVRLINEYMQLNIAA